MKKYLHRYDSDEQFEAIYNGSAYTEPWVSLTVSSMTPSGHVVAFIDAEGYRFERIGIPYNEYYPRTSAMYIRFGETKTITSSGDDGTRYIVVDGNRYDYDNKYIKEVDLTSQILYERWYDSTNYLYVYTEYGHSSQGDDAFFESDDNARKYWNNYSVPREYGYYGTDAFVGGTVYIYENDMGATKVVRIEKLIYESYTPQSNGRVDYNKKSTPFRVIIPPGNSIYYKADADIYVYDGASDEGIYRPATEEEKLAIFSGTNGFVSSHYDSSMGLYVAEYDSAITDLTDLGHFKNFAHPEAVTEIYLPDTLQNARFNSWSSLGLLERIVIGSGVTYFDTSSYSYTYVKELYIGSQTAPTVIDTSFGSIDYAGELLGIRNPEGVNTLYVPSGATGYNTGYWQSIALNPDLCDFHIENI